MSIANAVQRGRMIYVYNERNQILCSIPVGNGPSDGLKGYTQGQVNVQRGWMIYSYDSKGRLVASVSAR